MRVGTPIHRQYTFAGNDSGDGRNTFLQTFGSRLSGIVFAIAGFSAVINVLALTGSLFMLEVYDRVLPSRSLPTLVVLSLLTTGLFLFYGILEFVRARILVRLASALDAEISAAVFQAWARMPLARASLGQDAELRDLDIVRSFASGPGPTVLFDLPWVPFYLWVIYLFHPLLASVALAGILALLLLTLITEACCRTPTRAVSRHAQSRQQLAETTRRHGEALSAMGMAACFSDRLQNVNDDYVSAQQRLADISSLFGTLARVVRISLQSAILATGAYLVIRHAATSGVMIAASVISARALAPLDTAIPNWKAWSAARESWKRLSHFLGTGANAEAPLSLPAPRQSLSVDCVSVSPPGAKILAVCDASFRLVSGQGLGIIGRNASGKSSLARLLVGAWTPTRGEIRLDGASLDQWSPDTLGRHIGYLPQDVALLPGTIAENISRFDTDARADEIIAAAKAADVHDLIVKLPDGYDTLLNDPMSGLSTGHRQRIALARALYKDPFLVVLDEPSANLDPEGEAALLRAIAGVRHRGGIAVIIAHHPSALATVDTLLVMHGGRVEMIGRKEEILPRVMHRAGPPKPLTVVAEKLSAAE